MDRSMKRLCVMAVVAACSAAHAETSSVSPSGFVVTHRLQVKATPQRIFEAIGRIDRWWNMEHSYSGQASSMSLDLNAGGCFCERWEGGSVMHAQVVFVDRRNHVVRLLGGLGPLQERAVSAMLSLAARTADEVTTFTLVYRVFGPAEAGLEKLAQPVDQVLGDAAQRLVAYVESGKP